VISKLIVKSKEKKRLPVPWWTDSVGLKNRKTIEFLPGLNVIVGPNGCGKSTLLRTIARILQCEQGGTQMVTSASIMELFSYKDEISDGVEIIHSGCPVTYFDAEATPGLFCGAFDWDLDDLGIQAVMFKGSSGQNTQRKLNRLLSKPAPEVEWKVQTRKERSKPLKKILKGTKNVPKGATMLFDEPERALDTINQIIFWKNIIPSMVLNNVQVIVASHSTMPYDDVIVPHFIELEPRYSKKTQEMLRNPKEAVEEYVKKARAKSKK